MLSHGKRPFNVLGISQYFLPLFEPSALRLGVLTRYTQNSGLVNWTILCASPSTLPHAADPELQTNPVPPKHGFFERVVWGDAVLDIWPGSVADREPL